MKTDTVIRQEGMRILIKNLGNIDAERFVALMSREPFDYTEWRKTHLEDEDVETFNRNAVAYSKSLEEKTTRYEPYEPSS